MPSDLQTAEGRAFWFTSIAHLIAVCGAVVLDGRLREEYMAAPEPLWWVRDSRAPTPREPTPFLLFALQAVGLLFVFVIVVCVAVLAWRSHNSGEMEQFCKHDAAKGAAFEKLRAPADERGFRVSGPSSDGHGARSALFLSRKVLGARCLVTIDDDGFVTNSAIWGSMD